MNTDDAAPVAKVIRVLMADDHELYLRGLEMVLSREHDIELVGEALDGTQTVGLALSLRPDVVLMDLKMPRMDGIEACAAIKSVFPEINILMVTGSDDEADLLDAVRAGANGYLLKDVPTSEYADAIRAVNRGQALISPRVASTMMTEFAALMRHHDERGGERPPQLTRRELEVLGQLGAGLSNREIATELFISENTVKNHVASILEKLGAHSRMEAVVIATKRRIIEGYS